MSSDQYFISSRRITDNRERKNLKKLSEDNISEYLYDIEGEDISIRYKSWNYKGIVNDVNNIKHNTPFINKNQKNEELSHTRGYTYMPVYIIYRICVYIVYIYMYHTHDVSVKLTTKWQTSTRKVVKNHVQALLKRVNNLKNINLKKHNVYQIGKS